MMVAWFRRHIGFLVEPLIQKLENCEAKEVGNIINQGCERELWMY
jgi:hypothetical protein